MLTYLILSSISGLAGAVFAAYRLRGERTMMEAARAVVLGGGGPRPVTPR